MSRFRRPGPPPPTDRQGHGFPSGRRTLVITVLLAAVLALIPLGAIPSASAAPTLISQGKPVTASSTESAAYPASAAVDGNTGTRWSSAFSDPQWIQVDLGAPVPLS